MELRITITKPRFYILATLLLFIIASIIFTSATIDPTKSYHPVQQVTKALDPDAAGDYTSIDENGDGIVDTADSLTQNGINQLAAIFPEIAIDSGQTNGEGAVVRNTPFYPSGTQAVYQDCHIVFGQKGWKGYDSTNSGGSEQIDIKWGRVSATQFNINVTAASKADNILHSGVKYLIICQK